MQDRTKSLWKLGELAERSRALLLRHGEAEGDSRRVRWVPNPRLIRYYTTLGLLDRPAEMRGRTALYGPRHLLQLLAIKRLQQDGRSLEEIQRELAGLPDSRLQVLAALPSDWQPQGEESFRETVPASELSFWEQRPSVSPPRVITEPGSDRVSARSLLGIRLVPGAELLLCEELTDRVDPDDLLRAARPLIEYLQSRMEERDHD